MKSYQKKKKNRGVLRAACDVVNGENYCWKVKAKLSLGSGAGVPPVLALYLTLLRRQLQRNTLLPCFYQPCTQHSKCYHIKCIYLLK